MVRSRARLIIALAASVIVGSGCLHAGVGSGADPFGGADENRILVRVENLADSDMTVSALGPRQRQSLGVVPGRSSARFEIPWRGRDFLRFQIEPMDGAPHTTDAVSLEPGEQIQLFLQWPASRSTVRR